MCGICGFLGEITENKANIIEKMTDAMVHRGPDDVNFFIDDKIAMGFRRLSIIDLKSGGQPIYSENNNLVLTFNGEIYNHLELRKNLEELGHKFYTKTDSEVIVHAFEEWGEKAPAYFRGMFAFSIWDRENKTLFLARDFFGIKPLHYCFCEGNFVYASEIKSILKFPNFKKKLNFNALDRYLSFQYSPGSETFFEDVFCLNPGHFMWVRVKEEGDFSKTESQKILSSDLTNKFYSATIGKYSDLRFCPDENLEFEETVKKIADVFEESVNSHKISDVEVGCFLSSGIDSSLVASYFKGQKSFTVGFAEDDKYNEISWAESFSEFAGISNFSHIIKAEEYWDKIGLVQYHMDQPLGDPSCVALYFVCNLASKHVKVTLSGEGADELFGGYPVYNEPRVFKFYHKLFPQNLRTSLANLAKKIPFYFKGRGFLIRGEKKIEDKFIGNAFIFSKEEKQEILRNKELARDPIEIAKNFYEKVQELDDVAKMQYLDVNLWMVGDILLKADRMSMANSLELRVPFLDIEVFKIASTLPARFKTNKKNTKYALRAAASKRLPERTSEKPKLGFPVPIRVWLRQEKYYKVVLSAFKSDTAELFFDTGNLCKLLNEHLKGKWDLSRKIWTVYIFIVWYNMYFKESNKENQQNLFENGVSPSAGTSSKI
ncbi:MAG: asparagine synthase (glutamine-hydrolyzing) [Oscillospiraceae bacterium]|nr:asparagine synthase (glutamine-hydrolyzing) [Oscillospiraceae bacterium]